MASKCAPYCRRDDLLCGHPALDTPTPWRGSTILTINSLRDTDNRLRFGDGVRGTRWPPRHLTELHNARRIDLLAGRASRQSDAGSLEAIVSLEDGCWIFRWSCAGSFRQIAERLARSPHGPRPLVLCQLPG